ncbi:MAG: hypothetical protein H7222_15640 [Methylotenera sp.]|nr:hypothetical protein [Oligoflexia bacterium]
MQFKTPRFKFLFRGLSIKVRLGILFTSLMLLVVVSTAFVLFQHHKLAIRASNLAIQQHSELESAFYLREVLNQIERANRKDVIDDKVSTFRKLLDESQSTAMTPEEASLTQNLDMRFQQYLLSLGRSGNRVTDPARQESYEDISAALAALISRKQLVAYNRSYALRQEQENSVRFGLFILTAFVILLGIVAFLIISVVTKPLSALAQALDELSIEDDLHNALPKFAWDAPEIARVASSFEQLLHRLRGYRAINIRRLLIEKRRADIIAASIFDGVFLLRNDEILYVNPVGERILSLPRGQSWKGLTLTAPMLPGQEKNTGFKAVLKSVQRTMPVEFEVEIEDQRKLHYLLRSYPITEEVIEQVEHAFDGPVEQLLDRWQANTLVIAQDITLVKEGQDAKGHFIATLSHEVKTPVTSLTMATRLLLKTIDKIPDASQRSLIETCASDVDRLRGLIDNLLSVSKFDALTQKLELQVVNISKLLKQSVQAFQPQAFERGIEMGMQGILNHPPVSLTIDATKISWAISNLLTNALRHTPRGGRVEVVLETKDDNLEITIRDNGPGIEKNRQDRIFDKFNPFYDLRIARSGSVGMGMAIAREIIVAHGGRIWVTSEPGFGAEFCFVLPLKAAPVMALTGSPGNTLPGSSLNSNGPNLKGDPSVTSARS